MLGIKHIEPKFDWQAMLLIDRLGFRRGSAAGEKTLFPPVYHDSGKSRDAGPERCQHLPVLFGTGSNMAAQRRARAYKTDVSPKYIEDLRQLVETRAT